MDSKNPEIRPIFISHSSKDKKLVGEFVDLLVTGLGIDIGEILSSSTSGATIDPGEDWKKVIRDNLKSATIIFLVITENYIKSQDCLIEAGAGWMNNEAKIIPLVLGPITLTGMLYKEIQFESLSEESDLDIMKDLVLKALPNQRKIPIARWNEQKGKFVASSLEYEKVISKEKDINKEPEIIVNNPSTYPFFNKKIWIILLAILLMFLCIGFGLHIISFSKAKSGITHEKNFTHSLADFADLDLKLSLYSRNKKIDTVIANDFKELLPYVEKIESAKKVPKNFDMTLDLPPSLVKRYDSAKLMMSRFILIRTTQPDTTDSAGIQIADESPVSDWYPLGLEGEYETFGQLIKNNKLKIHLIIRQ